MSGAVETDTLRQFCLENVLEINPGNRAATRGLGRLSPLGPEPRRVQDGSPENQRHVLPDPGDAHPSIADAQAPPREAISQPSFTPEKAESTARFSLRPSPVPVVVVGFMVVLVIVVPLAIINARPGSSPSILGLVNLLLALVAAIFSVWTLLALVRRLFTRYTLRSDHLLVERGILTRSRKMIPIHRFQDVATQQSLIERPFGIGDAVVESAGEAGGAVLYDLPRCKEYTHIILRAVEERGGNDRGLQA